MMTPIRKRGLLALLLCFALVKSVQAEQLPGILIVEVAGLKDAAGDIYIAVYDSDDTWLSEDALTSKKVAIADALDGELVRTEIQLPVGTYAFTIFHDVDNDGELKTNFIGLPKEPLAMSNNAEAKFGPPKFEDAVFNLGAEPVIQNVTMKMMF